MPGMSSSSLDAELKECAVPADETKDRDPLARRIDTLRDTFYDTRAVEIVTRRLYD